MGSALQRHWFLIGLVIFIPLALVAGTSDPPGSLVRGVNAIPTAGCTAAILFLMSITLDTGKLLASARRPTAVIAAIGVNQLVIPILALPLLTLQRSPDLRVGLLIAASVPCTMAGASVWTRRANGNDAVSLLVTLTTNGLCFIVTPAWMAVGNRWFGTADAGAALTFSDMMTKLVLAALLPACIGQLLRLHRGTAAFVDAQKSWFSILAQLIIMTLVIVSAFRGGLHFQNDGMANNLRHAEFAIVWACCVAVHCAAMGIAWMVSGGLKLSPSDRRACVIAGSQKTLPVGILVSQATGLPFSLLPMLAYHASQLFIDTWVADRMKRSDGQGEDIT